MPRPILVPAGAPGIVSYVVGPRESWTLLALTVAIDARAANDDDSIFMEARTPIGKIIYRQLLGFHHGTQLFYSLAPDAEPWDQADGSQTYWPQQNQPNENDFVTERMSAVSLTSGCQLSVYTPLGTPSGGTDPQSQLDTGVLFSDLHLWVEDDDAGANVQPVALPAALAYEPTMSA